MYKLLTNPFFIIAMLIFTVSFSLSLEREIQQTQQAKLVINKAQNQLNQTLAEKQLLEKQLIEAQSEFYREKIIRDQLIMQKPNEVLLKLPDHPQTSPTVTPTPTSTNLQKWADTIKINRHYQ